jgi:hypothetical protein
MAAVERNAMNFMRHLLDTGDPVAVAGNFAAALAKRAVRLGWFRAAALHLEVMLGPS